MKKKFVACACLSYLSVAASFTCITQAAVDDVFVSLTRRPSRIHKLPTNVTMITSKEIERSGATTLAEVLDLYPSVDLSRSGFLGSLTSVRLRGVPTSDHVQVLVDDQPLGGVSIQSINVGLIPVENIDRIEIVRGGSSVLYGANTIGGVVHIFTKRQRNERVFLDANVEGRSHQTKITNASIGSRGSKADGFLNVGRYETGGFQQNSDADNKNFAGNIGYSFSNAARISVDAAYIDHEIGTPNGTPVPFDQWDGEKEKRPNSSTSRVENKHGETRIKAIYPFAKAGTVQSVVHYSRDLYKLRLSPSADPLSTFDNRIIGNDTRFIFTNGVTVGGSYGRDERRALTQLPHHATNWGAYLQDQISWRKVDISPAIRFDQHGTFGNQYNPRLSVVYHALPDWQLSANAARSFRAPTLVDLYVVATDPFFPAFDFFGNPNLKPEIAWTYDVGTRLSVNDGATISLTGYYSRIEDRITPVDSDGNGFNDTLRNLSTAELVGAEVELKAQTGPFSHRANHAFQRAKGSSATSAKFVPLRLTPKHIANYELAWAGKRGLQLINILQYVAKQFEFDGERGNRLPSYTLWHARVQQKIKFLTLFAGVQNITDKRYAESITFGNPVPQPGRIYSGGINMTFGAPSAGSAVE